MATHRREVQAGEKGKKTVGPQQGSGILCPHCGSKTKVKNSIPKPNTNNPEESVHGRYRQCDKCGKRIYTEEKLSRFVESRIEAKES